MWYAKYVTGEKPIDTPELLFGKYIDERLQNEPDFLPEVPRYPILQHKMETAFNGIPLIGIADTFRKPERILRPKGKNKMTAQTILRPALRDYKTGRKKWDHKRAHETGQLTMYCFMLWQIEKIRPEDVELHIDWLPTHYVQSNIQLIEPVVVQSFKTHRTMQQVAEFGQIILDTYQEMIDYCENRPEYETTDIKNW